jgi:hypothetical protein
MAQRKFGDYLSLSSPDGTEEVLVDAGDSSKRVSLNKIPVINALTEKEVTVGADQIVIADSEDSNALKKVEIDNLPFADNTASNVGDGDGEVFKTKSGSDLQFRTVKAGTGISITNNTNDITLSTTTGVGEANTASNVGNANAIFKQKSGVDLEFRSLYASDTSGLDITYEGENEIGFALDIEGMSEEESPQGSDLLIIRDVSGEDDKKVTLTNLLSVAGGSPLTTKGDLYTYDTDGARLPVGSDGTVLVADSNETTGLKWEYQNAVTPISTKSSTSNSLFISDADVYLTNADAKTLSIPYNNDAISYSVAYPIGTKIAITNTGAGDATVQCEGSGITINGVDDGSFTLAQYAGAVIVKVGENDWIAPNQSVS